LWHFQLCFSQGAQIHHATHPAFSHVLWLVFGLPFPGQEGQVHQEVQPDQPSANSDLALFAANRRKRSSWHLFMSFSSKSPDGCDVISAQNCHGSISESRTGGHLVSVQLLQYPHVQPHTRPGADQVPELQAQFGPGTGLPGRGRPVLQWSGILDQNWSWTSATWSDCGLRANVPEDQAHAGYAELQSCLLQPVQLGPVRQRSFHFHERDKQGQSACFCSLQKLKATLLNKVYTNRKL